MTVHSTDLLRHLNYEVSKLAEQLHRLSQNVPDGSAEEPAESVGAIVSAESVRSVIRMRQDRARFLPSGMFADPAWSILLDLLLAELSNVRVATSSLCIAAGVPTSTALRCIKSLVANGSLIRRSDPFDGRRVFVELDPQLSQNLRRYFAEVVERQLKN